MPSIPLVSSPVKALMVIVGLSMGALDVREKLTELNKAMDSPPSARAIGDQMIIRDPYFVVKTWSDHAATCPAKILCYSAPPDEMRALDKPIASWARVGPVLLLRMAVFPIFQTGRTLFQQGWTARAIFLFSFIVAFLLIGSRSKENESLSGGLFLGVLGFLVVSIVLSFAFNLLLRLGNTVAGYWGVLVALAACIYFTLELGGKLREFLLLWRAGKSDGS